MGHEIKTSIILSEFLPHGFERIFWKFVPAFSNRLQYSIARTHGGVRNNSETHETV